MRRLFNGIKLLETRLEISLFATILGKSPSPLYVLLLLLPEHRSQFTAEFAKSREPVRESTQTSKKLFVDSCRVQRKWEKSFRGRRGGDFQSCHFDYFLQSSGMHVPSYLRG